MKALAALGCGALARMPKPEMSRGKPFHTGTIGSPALRSWTMRPAQKVDITTSPVRQFCIAWSLESHHEAMLDLIVSSLASARLMSSGHSLSWVTPSAASAIIML